MTWKALDPASLPVRLEQEDGTGLVYANLAAAVAAGWSFIWMLAAAAVSPQPSPVLTADPEGASGDYYLTHNLVQGVHTLLVKHATYLPIPDRYVLVVGADDADSIAAQLAGALGTLVSSDRAAQYDWEWTEGDSFSRTMVFPSSALSDFGIANLSDIAGQVWSIRCFARKDANVPAATKDFELPAAIVSKTDRTVKIQIPAGLTGATITSGDSQAFEYDVQVEMVMPRAITAVTIGAGGTFRVSGDQRLYFGIGKSFTVTLSTGNNGTHTPTAVSYDGTNTTITVATVPNAIADGNANGLLRITGLKGVITCNEQETDV